MNLLEYRSFARGNDWTGVFCAAVNALQLQGGGTLEVSAGLYQTHSIELCSNMTLQLDSGAVLQFFPGPEGYGITAMEFEGIPGQAYVPLIYANGAKNVSITGNGVINGNGASWWDTLRKGELAYPRPYLMCFKGCQNVVVENVTLINSPAWTIHPLYCEDVTIRGVTIRNPANSPNTDGINPNGCRNVFISQCVIDVGDDCVAIKSGTEDTPRLKRCENILISNCIFLGGHGGVVIGSEMSGSVRNVQVTHCIFQGTDRGIRVKTRRKRGGRVENLSFSHLLMDDVKCPFVFNMFYFCGKDGKLEHVSDKTERPVDKGTPGIFDVSISNVTVRDATTCAGFVYGLPEMPVTRLSLSDVTITMQKGKPDEPAMMEGTPTMEAEGFFLRNARDVSFQRVHIIDAAGEKILQDETVAWDTEK